MDYNVLNKINEIELKTVTIQSRLDDIETQLNCTSSDEDTMDLIEEEVHWIIKFLRRFFCYHR